MVHSQQRRTKHAISPVLAFVMVATITISAVSTCDDVPPDSRYSCHQQAIEWKKCNEPWMKNKCNKSCGRCGGGGGGQPGGGGGASPSCTDVPPDSKYNCHQQAIEWKKCNEPWMKNKCDKSCGRCGGGGGGQPGGGGGASPSCTDVPPDSKYNCHQQAIEWKKCDEPWMKNKCDKSCGRCTSGPSGAASPQGGSTNEGSLKELDIRATGDMVRPVGPMGHGDSYRTNKAKVLQALKSVGLSGGRLKLCFAIGMLETSSFDPKDRDNAKDGAATNYSAWNYNQHFLSLIGVKNFKELNSWAGLDKAAAACKKGMEQFGVYGFLNFHRGGWTGYKDPTQHDCYGYRNRVATMIRMLDADPSLMTDGRRIH